MTSAKALVRSAPAPPAPAPLAFRTLLMHQVMLSDRVRLRAYDQALRHTLRPGDIVLDVGAGTLALSLLALRHGAGHVYAVEADPQLAALAVRTAAINNLHDRLTVIHGDVRAVRLPRPADVIVSEMMGNIGPEEEMPQIIADAAAHNLAPGGRIVPERLTTFLQGVDMRGEGWGVWSDDFFGWSLRAVREHASSDPQLHVFAREPVLLTDRIAITDDRLGDPPGPTRRDVDLAVRQGGTLHAVIGWFVATMPDGSTLSNFPSYPGTNWAVWVWPLRHFIVQPGDEVRIRVELPDAIRDAARWRLDCQINRSRRTS